MPANAELCGGPSGPFAGAAYLALTFDAAVEHEVRAAHAFLARV